jgi:hypothetical protein
MPKDLEDLHPGTAGTRFLFGQPADYWLLNSVTYKMARENNFYKIIY